MAKTTLVEYEHLDRVREYFVFTGWQLCAPRGRWEVLRVRRLDHKRPVLVYRSSDYKYLVINDYDLKIFTKFLWWFRSKVVKEE